jgi:hypothetical protein
VRRSSVRVRRISISSASAEWKHITPALSQVSNLLVGKMKMFNCKTFYVYDDRYLSSELLRFVRLRRRGGLIV